ncbi:MAG: glycosyltransferase family 2 protein [Roseomonas sp.]|nr:glycosyltransferase family 2 protein [Roseomonas sp.]MCA3316442.1 glycosyltransferase family 2 protein [Roseomonas sp.]
MQNHGQTPLEGRAGPCFRPISVVITSFQNSLEAPLLSQDQPALSIVVPAYNEEEVLPQFHARLAAALAGIGLAWEVVYVNDGSKDGTLAVMLGLQAQDQRASVLNLSRNFGKEIALTAGLDHARGTEAVVVIDADLQDPPEVIPDLIAAWRRGFDIAYAQRNTRAGETWLKKATASGFYRLMQRISGKVHLPPDTGDFRLMSRRALDALLKLREQHRFMKGLFAWIGFPAIAVRYDRAPRAAGTTKWNYWKLWNFSLEGITSFTVAPLKIATYIGLITAIGALAFLAQLIFRTIFFGNPVAGYPSLLAVTLFLGGVQMMMLGIIGEYLGRIFNETKGRPLYLVERYLPGDKA